MNQNKNTVIWNQSDKEIENKQKITKLQKIKKIKKSNQLYRSAVLLRCKTLNDKKSVFVRECSCVYTE